MLKFTWRQYADKHAKVMDSRKVSRLSRPFSSDPLYFPFALLFELWYQSNRSRTQSKAESAIENLKKENSSFDVQFQQLDLDDLSSVRKAVEDIKATEDKIDILVCNAGIMATPYKKNQVSENSFLSVSSFSKLETLSETFERPLKLISLSLLLEFG